MAADDNEDKLLRSVALQNANTILLARQHAERELIEAKEALERKTEELAHTLAMMRATLESTTDGILVTSASGDITDFNQNFVYMWRLPPEAMSAGDNRRVLKVISRNFNEPEKFCAGVEEIYASFPPESFDLLELADGRVFERYSRIQYIDGRNVGRVWSFRDITERIRVEEEIRQQHERKDQFLATLAHELRNPLVPIRNGLEILHLAGDDAAMAENARSIMDQALHQMVRLVDDLLDMSRITTGKMQVRKERIELATVIRKALSKPTTP